MPYKIILLTSLPRSVQGNIGHLSLCTNLALATRSVSTKDLARSDISLYRPRVR